MHTFGSDKTYFVGIGVQKAGTTWLNDYFDSRQDTLMSPIKELHYFDAEFRSDQFMGYHRNFAFKTQKLLRIARERTSKEVLDEWINEYLAPRLDVLTTTPREDDFEGSDFPFTRRLYQLKMLRRLFEGNIKALRSGTAKSPPDSKIRSWRVFERLENTTDRAFMAFDPAGYVKYFNKRVAEEHVIFGEFTPSYALLRQDGFERIRAMNKRTKIILLLRDPVDRFYSLMRMRERRVDNYDLEANFRSELKDPAVIERGMYRQTYTELRKVFRSEDVHVEFFETLFCNQALKAVCDFLSVPFIPGQYEERLNAAPTPPKALPAVLRDEARKVFNDAYAFARSEFGSRVPSKWLA